MERWIAVVLAVLVWAASLGAQEEPPEARRGDHVDVYHGVEVPDPEHGPLPGVSEPQVAILQEEVHPVLLGLYGVLPGLPDPLHLAA